jgi:hypothetical protein
LFSFFLNKLTPSKTFAVPKIKTGFTRACHHRCLMRRDEPP